MVVVLDRGEALALDVSSVDNFGIWDITPQYTLLVGVGEVRKVLRGRTWREVGREEMLFAIPVWRYSLAKHEGYRYSYLSKKVRDFLRVYDLSVFDGNLVGGIIGLPEQLSFTEGECGFELREMFEKYMRIIVAGLKKLEGPVLLVVHLFGDEALGRGKLHIHVHFVCRFQRKDVWMRMVNYFRSRGFGRVEYRAVRKMFGYLFNYASENTLVVIGRDENFNYLVKTKHGYYYLFSAEEAMNFSASLDTIRRHKTIRTIRVPYRQRMAWEIVESRFERGVVFVEKVFEEEENGLAVMLVRYVFAYRVDMKFYNLVLLKRKLTIGEGVGPPVPAVVDLVERGLGGEIDALDPVVDELMRYFEDEMLCEVPTDDDSL